MENYGKEFMKYSDTINDVYNNINNYKQDRNHMILTLTAIAFSGPLSNCGVKKPSPP